MKDETLLKEENGNVKTEKVKKEKKIRTLCKMVKRDYLKKDLHGYQALVMDPHFICSDCGRVAKESQHLCSPVPITPSLVELELTENDIK